MTNPAGYAFVAEDSSRVPTANEDINYDDAVNPAIHYPDSWTVPDGRNELGETVEEANPRLFYKPEPHKPPAMSDTWRANTIVLTSDANGNSVPVLILGPNPKRKRVILQQGLDSAGQPGTGTAYVGPSAAITAQPNGGGFQIMTPDWANTDTEITHTGAIYACVEGANSIAVLMFIEESYP